MRPLHATVAVLLAASSPLTALAQIDEARLRQLAVDDLKRVYLACDQAAAHSRMSSLAIAQCSVVYDELRRRGFDGDGERLFAWSRSQRRTEHAQAGVR